ncbi:MAG: efflux transporter outer membrane subunit [Armatimonadetes bacterium]|nr:efflux transporter outer membrane subunit [Akkermansiaceae bacterium]
MLVFAGCKAVGPDYEVPQLDLPAGFSQSGVKWTRVGAGKEIKNRSWWRVYGDGTLNAIMDRSLANNQELAGASARLKQARALSASVRSLYFPSIDLGAGAERSRFRFRGPSGGSNIQESYEIPVTLRYEFDVWGKVRRQVESAEAGEAATKESLNALRLAVAGEVAQTYWALRAVDADREILSRAVELRQRAFGILKKQQEGGAISGLDLSRAETELASADAERIRLDQDRVELVNALAVLSGSVAIGSKVNSSGVMPEAPGVPVSVPSDVLRQRPDIRAAERRVAAANAEIGVATAAFYPSVSIDASGGFDSTTLGDLFTADSLVWSLGPNVSIPLTGQKFLRQRRDAALAAHEVATAEYRQTVLDAMREAENAIQAVSILKRREAAQRNATESARKTFDLSTKRYEGGLVNFLDVVDAERSRLDSERLLNAVKAEQLAISVALFRAMGGAW